MTTAENPSAPRRAAWIAALLIAAVALALHVRFLNHAGGLWRDEVNLVNLAGHSALADFAHDSFPVLMPLAVHGWMQAGFGKTDFGLRCLGALIGCGIVLALLANAWVTRRAPPLVGLALFALNSIAILYGDSLRAYGLGSLTIVLTATAAWLLLHKPTWPRTALFALAAILSVQALYQNAILVGAICVGAFAVCWRRKMFSPALKIFLGGLLAAVSLLPYLPNLLTVPANAASLRTGFQPEVIRANLAAALGFPLPQYLFVWALLAVVVIGCGIYLLTKNGGARHSVRAASDDPARRARSDAPYLAAADSIDAQLFAAITLLAALVMFGGFLWFAALPTQPWYFLPLMALAAVCFDAGLPALPQRFRAAGFGLVLATALAATAFAWRDVNFRLTNVDVLAQRLAAVAAPGDYVVVTPWYCGIGFERYFKSTAPWTTLPPLADHSGHRYDLIHEQMKNPDAIAPVLEKISATLRAGKRVWVVGWMEIPAPSAKPPTPLPPPPLKYSGWSDMPYAITWAGQTAHFLRQHARLFEQVKLPELGAVNPNEDLCLFIAEDAIPDKLSGK
ncbi:MAG: hypothetical protein NTZ16_00075 [Verrucomicrobia bacterium]|nr:hypothetical protein [Verrucomicrobiota bacterium]